LGTPFSVDQLIALDADGKVGGWFFAHPHKHRHPPPRRLPPRPRKRDENTCCSTNPLPASAKTPRGHAAAHMARWAEFRANGTLLMIARSRF